MYLPNKPDEIMISRYLREFNSLNKYSYLHKISNSAVHEKFEQKYCTKRSLFFQSSIRFGAKLCRQATKVKVVGSNI